MASNYIKNVAIVGAGGHSGSFIANALLGTGKHSVSAISRINSQSKLPEGITVNKVDYTKPETIVDALRGKDALVITLGGFATQHEETLVRAAAEAEVPWIFPNEWSPDSASEALCNDVNAFQGKGKTRKLIEALGKSSFIGVSTGFWYEWSLAIPPAFGFDFATKSATFFDEGEQKISVSTWPQVGRAVAALLSLPISAPDNSPSLDSFKNKLIYTKSFTVSQKDMLASVLRVTGGSESDWTITKQPAQERYDEGVQQMKQGIRAGFAKWMYTRVFFSDGVGNVEVKGTANKALGLPEDDIDEATKVAIERSKLPGWHNS